MLNFEKLNKSVLRDEYVAHTARFGLMKSDAMDFSKIMGQLIELEKQSIEGEVKDKVANDIGTFIEHMLSGIFQVNFYSLGDANKRLKELGIITPGHFFSFPYSNFMAIRENRNNQGHNIKDIDIDTLKYLLLSAHKLIVWALLSKTYENHLDIVGSDIEYLKELLVGFSDRVKWSPNNHIELAKNQAIKTEERTKEYDLDNIQATRTTVFELIMNDEVYFHIPDYQRKYVWTEKQLDILIDDIETSKSKGKAHYFGVIAQKIEEYNDSQKSIIIDGQQRLTTSILLLKAIQVLLIKGRYKDDELLRSLNKLFEKFDGKNSRYINESWDSKEGAYERGSFAKIISWDGGKILNPEKYNNTRYYQNVIYFVNKLLNKYSEDFEIRALYEHILNKLVIVTLAYDTDAMDEMEIFESLNAKGTILSNLDLIKNFMLSKLSAADRTECNQAWENSLRGAINLYKDKMFGKSKNRDEKIVKVTDDFLLNYLKYVLEIKSEISLTDKETANNLSKDSIYSSFKEYVISENGKESITKESFLSLVEELRRCFSIYYIIKNPLDSNIVNNDMELKTVLGLLSSKDIHTTLAFMLFNKFGAFNNKNWLSSESSNGIVLQSLKIVLIYLLRLKLIQGDGQSLGPKIMKFTNELNKTNSLKLSDVNELFKKEFPEIKTQLSQEALYQKLSTANVLHPDSALHCLMLLENYVANEESENGWIWNSSRTKKPDKEHIMPVEFKQHWSKDIKAWNTKVNDKNIEIEHSKYIDMIGNYIPLNDRLNKSIKNNCFDIKKPKYIKNNIAKLIGPFDTFDDNVKLQPIMSMKDWSFKEIKKRSEVYAYLISFKILAI